MYQIRYYLYDLGSNKITFYKQRLMKNRTLARLIAWWYGDLKKLPHFIHFALVYEVSNKSNIACIDSYRKLREKYAR